MYGGLNVVEITKDHIEWAVVDRLRQMLEAPFPTEFNVTQTYALFTTIVCWVVQRIRVTSVQNEYDRLAAKLLQELSGQPIDQGPWFIQLNSPRSIAKDGARVDIDPPRGFHGEHRFAKRFLINLRDAIAHGDARQILPFHLGESDKQWLAGFTLRCEEKERGKVVWSGEITLLDDDMRRVGCHLAKIFCSALQRRHGEQFVEEARLCVGEVAA